MARDDVTRGRGRSGRARFPLFDGLRAMAAIAVVLYHAGPYAGAASAEGALRPYFARLNVGVAVFFAISGFLLYRPMLAARVDARQFSSRSYATKRVLRIVPAYWVALTVLMIYPGLPDMPSARSPLYYLFGQDYSPDTVHNGIGPAWTLGCEVIYYAILPLLSIALATAARRAGKRIWWRFELLAITTLIAGSVLYRLATVPALSNGPPMNFESNFGWFALGMLLALASVAAEEQRYRWLARVKRSAWLGWPAAVVAYVGLCHVAGTNDVLAVTSLTTTSQQLAIYGLSGVVALGLTLPAAFQTSPRGAIGGLLSSRVLTWLGLISYGLYLYHAPIMRKLGEAGVTSPHSSVRVIAVTATTLALAIGAAALSYYLIERPALRLGRRSSPTPAPVTPAPASTSA